MIVVSNTSPLRYLIEIEAVHVLPLMFGRIFVPASVVEELRLPHFPPAVTAWAAAPPEWLAVEQPADRLPELADLHDGEADAISLAVEREADRILLDERDGVEAAERIAAARGLGLRARGTLAVLAVAGELGHVELGGALTRLTTRTRFRFTRPLIDRFLSNDPAIRRLIAGEVSSLRDPGSAP